MFTLKTETFNKRELESIYARHKMIISTGNVYFQNVKALKLMKLEHVTQEIYDEYFRGILQFIEFDTSPMDTIIPNDSETMTENDDVLIINTETDEFKKVMKCVTLDDIYKTLPPTNDVVVFLKENPGKLPFITREVFIHLCIEKYLEIIDKIHLETLSNLTPVIEFVVNNITNDDYNKYIHTRKVNKEKTLKKMHNVFFLPELNRTKAFYESDNEMLKNKGIGNFDIMELISLLITNADTKGDMCYIVALYYTLSFGIADIVSDKMSADEVPHVKYIRDVLSKIC